LGDINLKKKGNTLKCIVGELIGNLPRPQLYYLGFRDSFTRKFLEESEDKLVLNLGCGETRYGRNHINLDIAVSREVDIVADAYKLPFKNNTFDYVFSGAVLEHVRRPYIAVEEIFRISTPGGESNCHNTISCAISCVPGHKR
jgi:SAM-dependent methyltransferase